MGEVSQVGDGDGYHQKRTVSDDVADDDDDGCFVRERCYRANSAVFFCVFKWC